MLWRFRQRLGDFIKGGQGTRRLSVPDAKDLSGDRQVEWSYLLCRLGEYAGLDACILDFGCGSGMLSIGAVSLGCQVTAIDLLAKDFPLSDEKLRFEQKDVMTLPETEPFNVIMHSSVIEHVGLYGRYSEQGNNAKDIEAMQKMRRLMQPDGVMLMTLPVGVDATIHPLHRVYGRERLPMLLEGFAIVDSMFWRKEQDNRWHQCIQEQAVQEEGTRQYYALGGFVLRKQAGI